MGCLKGCLGYLFGLWLLLVLIGLIVWVVSTWWMWPILALLLLLIAYYLIRRWRQGQP